MAKSSALCFIFGLLIFISLGGGKILGEAKQCIDQWSCAPGQYGENRCTEDCVARHGAGAVGICQPMGGAHDPRNCYCDYKC
ncbi:hypothetical protein LINGRAPRIM_LOCUS2933 [Linum grandiflorum]